MKISMLAGNAQPQEVRNEDLPGKWNASVEVNSGLEAKVAFVALVCRVSVAVSPQRAGASCQWGKERCVIWLGWASKTKCENPRAK